MIYYNQREGLSDSVNFTGKNNLRWSTIKLTKTVEIEKKQ